MANVISVGCLNEILMNGELHKQPINLQIVSLEVNKNSLQMQFSDSIHKTRPFEIILEDPTVLSQFAVVRLGSYELKSVKNESPEKFTFMKLQFTGIIRDISEIIGNPKLIESVGNLSSYSRNESETINDSIVNRPTRNSTEEKRKNREQQLSLYFNRDIAKLKLRKTILLQKKHHLEEQLTVWICEKSEIEKKIDETKEKIDGFNEKLEILTKKTAECQQKFNYYSELM